MYNAIKRLLHPYLLMVEFFCWSESHFSVSGQGCRQLLPLALRSCHFLLKKFYLIPIIVFNIKINPYAHNNALYYREYITIKSSTRIFLCYLL